MTGAGREVNLTAPSAPGPSAPVLEVRSLVKRFGDLTAVDDVSFHIDPGETYGLLGPNGAGKTTAISMVVGLIAPDSGTVHVHGEAVSPTRVQAKRHLGLVPQDLAIYPDLTGRENLTFFGRLLGMSRQDLKPRVDEVLEMIGLADRADDPAKEYSGGMSRRLNIGAGLLHRPSVLILDEPTVGVDPQSRNSILEAVDELTDTGTAVLYTTHYMEEAERLCDRIGIIDEGRLEAEGTRDELIELTGGVDHVQLKGRGDMSAAADALRRMAAVSQVDNDRAVLTLTVHGAAHVLADIVTTATGSGVALTDVEVTRPDLESVFLHLTGKALRD